MDPISLAITAVGILTPYFAKAGEAAAKKIGEDVYKLLKSRFEDEPIADAALKDFAQAPEDGDVQAQLRFQLRKQMQQHPAFAKEIESLVKQAEQSEASRVTIRQIAGENAKQIGQNFGEVRFNG